MLYPLSYEGEAGEPTNPKRDVRVGSWLLG